MAEQESTINQQTAENPQQQSDSEQQGKTFSQADVDKIVEARLAKERRSESYRELERKAAAYDKTVEENKTELQKAQERAAALEAENKRITRENLVSKVCLEKGIPAKFAQLITGDDEESITQSADLVAELQGAHASERTLTNTPLKSEGKTPHDEPSIDEQIQAAEKDGNIALAIALKSQKLLKHIQ